MPQEEDSPPRREHRRYDTSDDDAPAPPRNVNVLGIISLVLSIVGALISMIPCIGVVGGVVAGVGLLLGIIGLIVALTTKRTGVGLPIAGSVVGLVGLCIAGAWLAVSTLWVREVGKEVQAQAEKMAEKAEQEKKAIREGPAIEVTAAALQKEYDANSIAADHKYKGQVLKVKGRVHRVNHDESETTVELKTDEEGETVDCEFAKDESTDLAELKPGHQVTIRGRCKGQDGDSPTLEKCILVKDGAR